MKKIMCMIVSIFMFIGSFILINRLQMKNFTVFNKVSSETIETVKEGLIDEVGGICEAMKKLHLLMEQGSKGND